MKWIVTLESGIKHESVKRILEATGSSAEEDAPMIPVDGDVTVEVEGPSDLPKRAREHPEVKAVHPSSELTLY
ncbi:MAG: hypothetical protein WCE79_12390 [Xanthobacteraceae bacterium]